MIDLLLSSLTAAMQILFIHILFWDGMLLAGVRYGYDRTFERLDKRTETVMEIIERNDRESFMRATLAFRTVVCGFVLTAMCLTLLFLRKPLFDCLICMTSIWGTVLYFLFHRELNYLEFLFTVGGISTIIYGIVGNANDRNGESFVKEKEGA